MAAYSALQRSLLAWIVRARWLTAERARVYGRMVALAMALAAIGQFGQIVASTRGDPMGRPMVTDFAAFWSAARLAANGHAEAAYDEAAIRAMEQQGTQPAGRPYLPYLYPPSFLLLTWPLGLLGYLPAMALFAGAGTLGFAWCLRRLLPLPWPLSVALALPAAIMNATLGQSGFVAATGFAGAALCMDKRPLLAGLCLGLVACKPQFALAVPLVLVAARRWRTLGAFAASVLGLAAAAAAILGVASWQAFLHAAPLARQILLSADIWPKLLSVYAAVRTLGGGLAAAGLVQGASLVVVGCVLWRVGSARPGSKSGAGAEIAALVAGSMLCTPYVLDYDLVSLAVPMAWLAGCGARQGWRDWERAVLAALYVYPLVARTLNLTVHLPVGPVLIGALFALVARRALAVRQAPGANLAGMQVA